MNESYPSPSLTPAISVVIPMYNTEKYIGAGLESLLAQTFQDFEVIAVNNGSTDNSAAILQSYVPKFGGRLKISHIEKNSGGPSPAWNKGLNFSRGKYIYFLDSDDLIVRNALEILYNYAENFGADVVSMDWGLEFFNDALKPFPAQENLQIRGWHSPPFVNKPTLESDDIGERVQKICRNGVGWTAWQKFVLRDLLIENEITFANIPTSMDIIWCMEIFSCAKKILTVPDLLYIFRNNPTSTTRTKRTPEQNINFYMTVCIKGLIALKNFLEKKTFFQENPKYIWNLLEFYEQVHCNIVIKNLASMTPNEFYKILDENFSKEFGAYGGLIAYLCASSNLAHLKWQIVSQRCIELEKKLKEIQGG